jgi:hypothetical protein
MRSSTSGLEGSDGAGVDALITSGREGMAGGVGRAGMGGAEGGEAALGAEGTGRDAAGRGGGAAATGGVGRLKLDTGGAAATETGLRLAPPLRTHNTHLALTTTITLGRTVRGNRRLGSSGTRRSRRRGRVLGSRRFLQTLVDEGRGDVKLLLAWHWKQERTSLRAWITRVAFLRNLD